MDSPFHIILLIQPRHGLVEEPLDLRLGGHAFRVIVPKLCQPDGLPVPLVRLLDIALQVAKGIHIRIPMDSDEVDGAVRAVAYELVQPFEAGTGVRHAGGAESDGSCEGLHVFLPDVDGFGNAHAGGRADETGIGFVEAEDGGCAEVDFVLDVVGPDAGQG